MTDRAKFEENAEDNEAQSLQLTEDDDNLALAIDRQLQAVASEGVRKPGTQYTNKEFESDWHTEWKEGDYPSYRETYSDHTFPGRAAVVAAEDTQSDGEPGVAGLTGPYVGAYLKHKSDGTIER